MLKFTSIVGYTSCGPTYIESFLTIFGQCISVLIDKTVYAYSAKLIIIAELFGKGGKNRAFVFTLYLLHYLLYSFDKLLPLFCLAFATFSPKKKQKKIKIWLSAERSARIQQGQYS